MALRTSDYDQRNYVTLSVGEGYARWSKNYDARFDDYLDYRVLGRLATIDWARAGRAVDLACGTGRTGHWLRSKGVRELIGVDLSEAMLAHARARAIYSRLLSEDATATSLAPDAFDLVASSLLSEHLADVQPLFLEAARLLRDGGHFMLLGIHPQFQMRGIPTHFKDAETGNDLSVESHIHLLSDFVKAGAHARLRLLELEENLVDEEWIRKSPNMKKHLGQPIAFAAVWQK